jgi:hypothetical protein
MSFVNPWPGKALEIRRSITWRNPYAPPHLLVLLPVLVVLLGALVVVTRRRDWRIPALCASF